MNQLLLVHRSQTGGDLRRDFERQLYLEERSTNNHESKKGETADSLLRYSALADSWIP
jgi:hypothetical protein